MLECRTNDVIIKTAPDRISLYMYTIFTLSILDILAWTNSVDPRQMLQNAASDQGLHCLQLVLQYLDISTGIKMDLLSFYKKNVNH